MAEPVVSIIIPCYNSERWVSEAIESCLRQTYQPLEVIVVDDGSTDGSLLKIQAFGNRVKWVSGPNRGGCHARNRGFELSEGEYVMFLDADDKISPETVSRLVQALSGKSGYMAACEWRYLSQRGNKWKEFKPPQLPKTLDDIERELHGAHMPPGAWLQPRDIVTRIGGWDETLVAYQDVDFRLRCLLSGAKFIRVRGGRFYYRLHTLPSVSKTVSESALRSRLRVLEKIEQLMQQEELLDVYRLALAKAYRDLASSSTSVAPALSAHCLATMERLSNGAPIPAGQTWQHRLACRLLGVERKERLARFLARYGVGRSIRKAYQSSQTREPTL